VEQVLDRGTTVVFSTHILSDLERVAFNLAFLSEGRIALQAPLDELLEQVRAFTGSVTELAGLFARLGAQPLKRTPLDAGRERVLARLPAGVAAPQDAQAVNLEDLFAELT
jgi:ABC-2 type transport system ATP-binding protein